MNDEQMRTLLHRARGVLVVVALTLAGCGGGDDEATRGKVAPHVRLETSAGEIMVELFPEEAPGSVRNFLAYVDAGYYDGTAFHRVIPNFMIQGGGMTAALEEKKDGQRPPIENEAGNGLRNAVGTVAMARTADPNSAQAQFFINLADNRFLDRDRSPDKVGYAVFGKVVSGMETVRKIEGARTTTRNVYRDVPVEPILLLSARRAP